MHESNKSWTIYGRKAWWLLGLRIINRRNDRIFSDDIKFTQKWLSRIKNDIDYYAITLHNGLHMLRSKPAPGSLSWQNEIYMPQDYVYNKGDVDLKDVISKMVQFQADDAI